MPSKKEPTPAFRLNLGNAAAQKVDPGDPRLARLLADAESSPAPAGQGLTVEPPPGAAPPPVRRRRAAAPTVHITVAVDGPLPWDTLGDLADTQRNMNLRLTETDLQKLQWLSQCLPGTSIQKLCRDAIRSYVDARIGELIGR